MTKSLEILFLTVFPVVNSLPGVSNFYAIPVSIFADETMAMPSVGRFYGGLPATVLV